MTTADWVDAINAAAGDVENDAAASARATFAIKWVDMESGGNPCSTGKVTDYVVEAGIGQNYFDTKWSNSFGATLPALRAACSGNTQRRTRDLTDAEKSAQVTALMGMVRHFEDLATSKLADIGATWSTHDFYCLVKLYHGLPGIPKSYLGGALFPDGCADWPTFRSTVEGTAVDTLASIDSGTAHYYNAFGGIFDNAEKAASVLAGVDDVIADPLGVAQGLLLDDSLLVPAGILVGAAVLSKVNG